MQVPHFKVGCRLLDSQLATRTVWPLFHRAHSAESVFSVSRA
jgi:hypothetical protein